MQARERKQVTFNLNNGAPEQRRKAAEEAIPVLRQEQHRLNDKARSQGREFATALAAWSSREVGEALRPFTLEQDLRDARVIKLIAAGLTLTELVLTVVVSLVFAVSAPFLLLVALVSIFALKVGLLALWRNPSQPQQTRQRLRRYVIAPGLGLTMLALGVLVFARSAGVLALLLLPFINLALCALSLGCLGLAAGLFALGYLMSWSQHAEKRFDALEREAVETNKVLQRAEKVIQELRPPQVSRPPLREVFPARVRVEEPRPAPQVQTPASPAPVTLMTPRIPALMKRNGTVLTALLCVLAVSGSGCQANEAGGRALNPVSVAAPPPPTTAWPAPAVITGATRSNTATADEDLWLELWLDWSRSAEDQAFSEAVQKWLADLPELASAHGIRHVTAYAFGDRGWSAPEILKLDLPAPEAAGLDEAGALFKGARQQQEAQARTQQLTALRQALVVLTPEKLLPGKAVEPPCTDVRGCLLHIGAAARAQPRLVVMITDLADSCSHQLPELALEAANAALVVVILPEVPVTGAAAAHAARAADLWLQRRTELLRAVPGAVAIPYFGDPLDAAKQALTKQNKHSK